MRTNSAFMLKNLTSFLSHLFALIHSNYDVIFFDWCWHASLLIITIIVFGSHLLLPLIHIWSGLFFGRFFMFLFLIYYMKFSILRWVVFKTSNYNYQYSWLWATVHNGLGDAFKTVSICHKSLSSVKKILHYLS